MFVNVVSDFGAPIYIIADLYHLGLIIVNGKGISGDNLVLNRRRLISLTESHFILREENKRYLKLDNTEKADLTS